MDDAPGVLEVLVQQYRKLQEAALDRGAGAPATLGEVAELCVEIVASVGVLQNRLQAVERHLGGPQALG